MRYFPIFIDLERQKVVVVGGGETAAQKVRLLLKTDAKITVIASALTAELQGFVNNNRISAIRRHFIPSDLKLARLIYSASGDQTIDHAVSDEAQKLNIPVNVVDDQAACSFITPAIVDRSPVVVAVSTEGTAPVLAAQIKSKIDALLPANFGALARFAAGLRPVVAARIKNTSARRTLWQRIFKSRARNLVLQGHHATAWQIATKEIDQSLEGMSAIGRVSLIGVGSGDPDLLTLKAHARLQEADVIVLDGLVNPEILEFARRDARRLYVGKTPGQASIKQSQINKVMAREALEGLLIVRLQGGDDLHFSRQIEALKPLAHLGIETEIVPGVSLKTPEPIRNQSDKIHTQTVIAKG
jgi:uroporphyrin-III C-methyltransferase / precorrin-2 dehydrogenase / sirohydrochlorin ferrochelatase